MVRILRESWHGIGRHIPATHQSARFSDVAFAACICELFAKFSVGPFTPGFSLSFGIGHFADSRY